jgi:hypothetical protein
MNRFEAAPETKSLPHTLKSAWVKPTLERLSLKDAMSGNNGGLTDGFTPGNAPILS